jgi:hypothetical protein
VRWIDLGCPVDKTFDPKNPQDRGSGWMFDDQRPTLTLTYPRTGANAELTRILVGMHDYDTGLDMDSFQVVADFALEGVAAGQNLASKFKAKTPGVWELPLFRPPAELEKGKLIVSVQDLQGNVTMVAPVTVKERVRVGATLPADIELRTVPSDWGPSVSKYKYIYSDNRVHFVDPASRRVIYDID